MRCSLTRPMTAIPFAPTSETAASKAVIPPRVNRTESIDYDKKLYRLRNLIERLVNKLKQYRRIATRYEKTARSYLSMVSLGAILLWIKFVNTA